MQQLIRLLRDSIPRKNISPPKPRAHYFNSLMGAFILMLCGCHSVSYSRIEQDGEKIAFSSSSFFTKKQIKDVEYGVTPNGTRKFILKGYSDNQTEVALNALIAALQAYSNQHPPTPPANPAP